ncbi:MAG: hypothetical protein AAFV69_10315 [Pseudomonadota bacterium]
MKALLIIIAGLMGLNVLLSLIGMVWVGSVNQSYRDKIGSQMLDRMHRNPGVSVNPSRAEIKKQKDSLIQITAYEGESRSAARSLRVIVLDYDVTASKVLDSEQDQKPGYHRTKIDIKWAEKTGVLVIAGRPVELDLETSSRKPRAVLALESSSPIDVEGGYPGLLAGFRVAPYDSFNTTKSDHYLNGTDKYAFCSAIRLWSKHFRVRSHAVKISAIRNAERIYVDDHKVSHDGKNIRNLPTFRDFCSR